MALDIKKFSIHTLNTNVWKGYGWVKLPDGRVIQTMKYVKVQGNSIGFEDLTEEIGEIPDYDYDEPWLTIVSVTGFIKKTVKIKARYGAGYTNEVYYGNQKIYTFEPGLYEKEITFTYVDTSDAVMLSSFLGFVIPSGYQYYKTKKMDKAIMYGVGGLAVGSITGYLVAKSYGERIAVA